MRFNDYHKNVSAALRLDEEMARRFRTFMVRCYTRGVSANACLALLKQQPDIKQLLEERAKEIARIANEPTPGDAEALDSVLAQAVKR